MNSSLTKEQIIANFSALGQWLDESSGIHEAAIQRASAKNPWFTSENIRYALKANGSMLSPAALENWLKGYQVAVSPKTIGLILAGNIPLVGFHDVIAVLASGNTALIKLSSQDDVLIPYVLDELKRINPAFEPHIRFTGKLEGFDAVIATGSNNTSRYFDHYFGKYPHIIRRNRNSIAVLNGRESAADLHALGEDIFRYFGLGCRNVSKLYVPEGYDFRAFFEAIEPFKDTDQHHKYHNNYEYNKSIYLVNGQDHLDNGFVLVTADERLASPLAVVYHESYTDAPALRDRLAGMQEDIQCIVAARELNIPGSIPFGQTQCPGLNDYADGVDTLQFLGKLSR